jgi:hypothetical protein
MPTPRTPQATLLSLHGNAAAALLTISRVRPCQIKGYQESQNYKVHVIGVGLRVRNSHENWVDYGQERLHSVYGSDAPSLSSRLWLEVGCPMHA